MTEGERLYAESVARMGSKRDRNRAEWESLRERIRESAANSQQQRRRSELVTVATGVITGLCANGHHMAEAKLVETAVRIAGETLKAIDALEDK